MKTEVVELFGKSKLILSAMAARHDPSRPPAAQLRVRKRLNRLTLFLLSTIAVTVPTCDAQQVSPVNLARDAALNRVDLSQEHANLPLIFEVNRGQTDPQVKFLSRSDGYNLFLTSTAAVFVLQKPVSDMRSEKQSVGRKCLETTARQDFVLRMKFLRTNPAARVLALDEVRARSHYFIGNDPRNWRTNIPNYAKVQYENVYPAINLMLYGKQRQLEYDFIVGPGADPGTIRFELEGVTGVSLVRGNLVLQLPGGGQVVHRAPIIYQELNGRRRNISGGYVLLPAQSGQHQIGFELTGAYDVSKPLIIDPVLIFSTYLGGSGDDGARGIAADRSGNAYVAGFTTSTDFPTANPLEPALGPSQIKAFVSKLNRDGSALVYSTYLGGSYSDVANSIAVDHFGNAYVTGTTDSSDFPTANPIQPAQGGGGDAFVLKLNSDGSALIYSTYLGGSSVEYGTSIAVDHFGNAYVAGGTISTDFPTVHPLQPTNAGNGDAFVSKLNREGSALVYSTYLGGSSSNDFVLGIAVDRFGNAYVAGDTGSTDIPTKNPLQAANAGFFDGFVSKLNRSGSELVYSTYLGGNNGDSAASIAVDRFGDAYVAGLTTSTNFPIANPLQGALPGQCAAFISKFSGSGSALVYSTYLGGSGCDRALGIAVDYSGNAYVTGLTDSSDFPTSHPIQAANAGGPDDIFVAKLNSNASALVYSTYLGGVQAEEGDAIAVDRCGNAYVAGQTSSPDFPTVTPLQSDNAGGASNSDAFVTNLFQVERGKKRGYCRTQR